MEKIHHALKLETMYMLYFSKCRDVESSETKEQVKIKLSRSNYKIRRRVAEALARG